MFAFWVEAHRQRPRSRRRRGRPRGRFGSNHRSRRRTETRKRSALPGWALSVRAAQSARRRRHQPDRSLTDRHRLCVRRRDRDGQRGHGHPYRHESRHPHPRAGVGHRPAQRPHPMGAGDQTLDGRRDQDRRLPRGCRHGAKRLDWACRTGARSHRCRLRNSVGAAGRRGDAGGLRHHRHRSASREHTGGRIAFQRVPPGQDRRPYRRQPRRRRIGARHLLFGHVLV